MKLNLIVSTVPNLAPIATVSQSTNAKPQDKLVLGERTTAKREAHLLPSLASNTKALFKFVSICALGLQIPAALGAPLRGASQTPLAPLDNDFKLTPEEGGWDCDAYADGKLTLRGIWKQTPPDQWGTDIVQKMYVPSQNHDPYGPMEQIISWDITTQPFKMGRWPANARYGVDDIIVTTRAKDNHTFIWDLQVEARDGAKWTEQWVDTVAGDEKTMLRQRYSNRATGDLQLQDTFDCHHW